MPPGARPDGRGFTVTGAMTSLLGASGDDMAAILKDLGYVMNRRPKPAEPATEVAPGPREPTPAPEPEPPQPNEPVPEKPPIEEPPIQEPTIEPPAKEPPSEKPPLEEPPPQEPPAEEPPPERPPVEEPKIPPPGETAAASSSAAEPEWIEVWRPAPVGRRSDDARPRAERSLRQGRRRVDGEGEKAAARPESAKPHGGKRKQRAKREDGRGRFERPERHQPRERPIDPDSPFAALAALKSRLEKSGE
jgi:ATP-dependent RNA helicase SUPV3L1/SUV3